MHIKHQPVLTSTLLQLSHGSPTLTTRPDYHILPLSWHTEEIRHLFNVFFNRFPILKRGALNGEVNTGVALKISHPGRSKDSNGDYRSAPVLLPTAH